MASNSGEDRLNRLCSVCAKVVAPEEEHIGQHIWLASGRKVARYACGVCGQGHFDYNWIWRHLNIDHDIAMADVDAQIQDNIDNDEISRQYQQWSTSCYQDANVCEGFVHAATFAVFSSDDGHLVARVLAKLQAIDELDGITTSRSGAHEDGNAEEPAAAASSISSLPAPAEDTLAQSAAAAAAAAEEEKQRLLAHIDACFQWWGSLTEAEKRQLRCDEENDARDAQFHPSLPFPPQDLDVLDVDFENLYQENADHYGVMFDLPRPPSMTWRDVASALDARVNGPIRRRRWQAQQLAEEASSATAASGISTPGILQMDSAPSAADFEAPTNSNSAPAVIGEQQLQQEQKETGEATPMDTSAPSEQHSVGGSADKVITVVDIDDDDLPSPSPAPLPPPPTSTTAPRKFKKADPLLPTIMGSTPGSTQAASSTASKLPPQSATKISAVEAKKLPVSAQQAAHVNTPSQALRTSLTYAAAAQKAANVPAPSQKCRTSPTAAASHSAAAGASQSRGTQYQYSPSSSTYSPRSPQLASDSAAEFDTAPQSPRYDAGDDSSQAAPQPKRVVSAASCASSLQRAALTAKSCASLIQRAAQQGSSEMSAAKDLATSNLPDTTGDLSRQQATGVEAAQPMASAHANLPVGQQPAAQGSSSSKPGPSTPTPSSSTLQQWRDKHRTATANPSEIILVDISKDRFIKADPLANKISASFGGGSSSKTVAKAAAKAEPSKLPALGIGAKVQAAMSVSKPAQPARPSCTAPTTPLRGPYRAPASPTYNKSSPTYDNDGRTSPTYSPTSPRWRPSPERSPRHDERPSSPQYFDFPHLHRDGAPASPTYDVTTALKDGATSSQYAAAASEDDSSDRRVGSTMNEATASGSAINATVHAARLAEAAVAARDSEAFRTPASDQLLPFRKSSMVAYRRSPIPTESDLLPTYDVALAKPPLLACSPVISPPAASNDAGACKLPSTLLETSRTCMESSESFANVDEHARHDESSAAQASDDTSVPAAVAGASNLSNVSASVNCDAAPKSPACERPSTALLPASEHTEAVAVQLSYVEVASEFYAEVNSANGSTSSTIEVKGITPSPNGCASDQPSAAVEMEGASTELTSSLQVAGPQPEFLEMLANAGSGTAVALRPQFDLAPNAEEVSTATVSTASNDAAMVESLVSATNFQISDISSLQPNSAANSTRLPADEPQSDRAEQFGDPQNTGDVLNDALQHHRFDVDSLPLQMSPTATVVNSQQDASAANTGNLAEAAKPQQQLAVLENHGAFGSEERVEAIANFSTCGLPASDVDAAETRQQGMAEERASRISTTIDSVLASAGKITDISAAPTSLPDQSNADGHLVIPNSPSVIGVASTSGSEIVLPSSGASAVNGSVIEDHSAAREAGVTVAASPCVDGRVLGFDLHPDSQIDAASRAMPSEQLASASQNNDGECAAIRSATEPAKDNAEAGIADSLRVAQQDDTAMKVIALNTSESKCTEGTSDHASPKPFAGESTDARSNTSADDGVTIHSGDNGPTAVSDEITATECLLQTRLSTGNEDRPRQEFMPAEANGLAQSSADQGLQTTTLLGHSRSRGPNAAIAPPSISTTEQRETANSATNSSLEFTPGASPLDLLRISTAAVAAYPAFTTSSITLDPAASVDGNRELQADEEILGAPSVVPGRSILRAGRIGQRAAPSATARQPAVTVATTSSVATIPTSRKRSVSQESEDAPSAKSAALPQQQQFSSPVAGGSNAAPDFNGMTTVGSSTSQDEATHWATVSFPSAPDADSTLLDVPNVSSMVASAFPELMETSASADPGCFDRNLDTEVDEESVDMPCVGAPSTAAGRQILNAARGVQRAAAPARQQSAITTSSTASTPSRKRQSTTESPDDDAPLPKLPKKTAAKPQRRSTRVRPGSPMPGHDRLLRSSGLQPECPAADKKHSSQLRDLLLTAQVFMDYP